jgi:hypothetical protein
MLDRNENCTGKFDELPAKNAARKSYLQTPGWFVGYLNTGALSPRRLCLTGNSEVMQMLQTATFARYALGRDSPNNPSLATPSATT